MIFKVSKFLEEFYTLTNCVLFSSKSNNIPKFIEINGYIVKTMLYPEKILIDEDRICINPLIRKLCKFSFEDKIEINEFKQKERDIIEHLKIKVSIKNFKDTKNVKREILLDEISIKKLIIENLIDHIPTNNMYYYMVLFISFFSSFYFFILYTYI